MDQDREGRVRARAYAIWEREGRPEGEAERHWTTAEEELGLAAAAAISPGDEALPGTPGTGEAICPACNGTGQLDDRACPNCGGAGKVIEGIGGA